MFYWGWQYMDSYEKTLENEKEKMNSDKRLCQMFSFQFRNASV